MPEHDDREERHIQAMSKSLRRAIKGELAADDVDRLTEAAMGDVTIALEPLAVGDNPRVPAAVLERFRAWREADTRYRQASPDTAQAQELMRELNRAWTEYEAAVNAEDPSEP